jgi:predicted double-glycine peptidase
LNYIKQTDTFSCGPIALINARIFQGTLEKGTNEEIFRKYTLKTNCESPDGTPIQDFWRVAKLYKFPRIYKPTLEKLNSLLDLGHGVLINHGDKKRRHYSLIIGRSATKYDIVNHYCGATITPIKKAKFESDVWRDPKIWVVKA